MAEDEAVHQNDPTDHALAAIASLLDQSHPPPPDALPPEEPAIPTSAPPAIEAHGYARAAPGPMAALRLKWTVREDSGQSYVDETIGEHSMPMITGPLDRDAALRFVDDRERAARERFEELKPEMMGGLARPRRDDGDET